MMQELNNTKSDNNKFLDSNVVIEIFGIKFYFDDLLLICLLFFLYIEKINDIYLFCILFLLLIS